MIIDMIGKVINDILKLGTHNGIFHCDEVVGIAILKLAFMEKTVSVVRTRDANELSKLDIVIDVGGGKFDHHMAGFNARRNSGEKYASAGLVWREYGKTAIQNVVEATGISIGDDEIEKIKQEIDREIIVPVDMEDNGEKVSSHLFSFIPQFNPSWLEEPKYDKAFERAENIAREILREAIKDKAVKLATKKFLQAKFDSVDNGILEIPAQTVPWLEEVVSYNENHNNSIKFVIFPYPAGGWAAQSIPPSIEEKFAQLVSFPKEWAGGNEETLPQISGVKDATFCHNGRFFAKAKTKEAIIEMCKIAIG